MNTLIDRLTTSQRIELDEAIERRGGIKEFALRHGLNENSIRGALSRVRAAREAVEPIGVDEETAEWMNAPAGPFQAAPETPRLETPAVLPEPLQLVQPAAPLKFEKFLYISDIHSPLHDTDYIERLCRVAYHLDVKDLVIGGDFFDLAELSSHGDDIEMPDINQSLEIAGQVFQYIAGHFETVYALPGNHCRRLAKRLNKNLSFRSLVRMAAGDVPNVKTTENDYFLIDTPHGAHSWTVGHPRFFAAYPTKGLDVVAMQRRRNVIGAHSHTIGLARIGPYVVVSPGHLMRPDLTPYLVRGDGMSKHADQQPARGFVLVESTKMDGDVVTLFGDGLVRWSDFR